MSRRAEVRFYLDEDILGLAHTIARLRNDVTYPGDPGTTIHRRERAPSPVAKGTKDTVWVPQVAALGWVIVSRDHNIRENPAERHAVRTAGAKMVALSGDDATGTWNQLRLFMRWWPRIEETHTEVGPFIYLAGKSRFKPLDIS